MVKSASPSGGQTWLRFFLLQFRKCYWIAFQGFDFLYSTTLSHLLNWVILNGISWVSVFDKRALFKVSLFWKSWLNGLGAKGYNAFGREGIFWRIVIVYRLIIFLGLGGISFFSVDCVEVSKPWSCLVVSTCDMWMKFRRGFARFGRRFNLPC